MLAPLVRGKSQCRAAGRVSELLYMAGSRQGDGVGSLKSGKTMKEASAVWS
jgi:hypothetical protein